MRTFGNAALNFWSEGRPPLVVAEFGISHNGDFGALSRALLDYEKADIYKFQIHSDEEMYSDHRARDILHRAHLSNEELREVLTLSKLMGKKTMLTSFCPETARVAAKWYDEGLVDILKVGSGECDNWVMADILKRDSRGRERTIVVSLGMVRGTVPYEFGHRCAALHCVSKYPAFWPALSAIRSLMRQNPGAAIGFSDHSPSGHNENAVAATTLGAAILERHVACQHVNSADAKVEDNQREFDNYVFASRAAHDRLVKRNDSTDTTRWAKHYLAAGERISRGAFLDKCILTTRRVDRDRFDGHDFVSACNRTVIEGWHIDNDIEKGDMILWKNLSKKS